MQPYDDSILVLVMLYCLTYSVDFSIKVIFLDGSRTNDGYRILVRAVWLLFADYINTYLSSLIMEIRNYVKIGYHKEAIK